MFVLVESTPDSEFTSNPHNRSDTQVLLSCLENELEKMKYLFRARLHCASGWYGDTLCQFLGFESKAHTPR